MRTEAYLTKDNYVANARRIGKEQVQDFVLIPQASSTAVISVWELGKPDTGRGKFWLTFHPYRVHIANEDLPTLTLRTHEGDPLWWLRKCHHSPEYLFKESNAEKTFFLLDAQEELKNEIWLSEKGDGYGLKGLKKLVKKWDKNQEKRYDGAGVWARLWYKHIGEHEPPNCEAWGWDAWLAYEALAKFWDLYQKRRASFGEAPEEKKTEAP